MSRPKVFLKCQTCKKEFQRRRQSNVFCSKRCSGLAHPGYKGMWRNKKLDAKGHSSSWDIVWAAGIFEGEGTIKYCSTMQVTVPQKDPWILEKMQLLFGGSVNKRKTREMYIWLVAGERARRFIKSIYRYLSPRRKQQVDKATKLDNSLG